ncbi:MAG: glycosyltransferase family 4 protein, partial [Rhabdochlamydiaceae bacterium]|nr:glycosyltransferase family 4 protein [Rhabdochlamydiaceae bacterium]
QIENLDQLCTPDIVFFNSGRWIEQFISIREKFPKALFIYRTGGNEILKASLIHSQIPDHALRQSYWAHTINQTIDIMITNSAYTEKRLQNLGLTCFFHRCVGGVNDFALKISKIPVNELPVIFCAARFVHYKNHSLMVFVIKELVDRGHKFHIRLAGDGPLFNHVQQQAKNDKLTSVITFLGTLDNLAVCREIARANIYMQLSSDQEIQVPGGSYIHSEGMGRSILEALSAGVFVIAGRSGALSEIVTKDRGLLVEPNNYKKIADQVEPILECLPERKPFSSDYSWTNIFKTYEDLMENGK